MTENAVYLDMEGTGLDPATQAMLEIAIVDDAGAVLVNTPPAGISSWPEAQRIHGITPTMTAGAPELAQLAPQIEAAVRGRDVVILYLVEKQSLPAPDTVPSNCCTPDRPAGDSLTVNAVLQILKSQHGEH